MSLGEMKRIDVVSRLESTVVEVDKISVTHSSRTHLYYRWKENGIDHILHLAIDSGTIVPDDITADISLENDDTGTAESKVQKNKT